MVSSSPCHLCGTGETPGLRKGLFALEDQNGEFRERTWNSPVNRTSPLPINPHLESRDHSSGQLKHGTQGVNNIYHGLLVFLVVERLKSCPVKDPSQEHQT